MPDVNDHVTGLAFGRWRSQTRYAGVGPGDFSVRRKSAKRAIEIVDQFDIDPVYRLLRSIGSPESFDGNNGKLSHV